MIVSPLILAPPLFVTGLLLLTGEKRWRGSSAGWIASLAIVASFGLSVAQFVSLMGRSASSRTVITTLWEWIPAGSFHVDVSVRADPLSTVMVLTVSAVSALIFIYSIGYMHGDARFVRYFGYLSLFVFFMLLLVLADNFLLLYVGWEGVGLCSYLLIGHWFERKVAADAAKKAFIVTRVGDAAFMIGIIIIWLHFHTLEFGPIFHAAPSLAGGTATVICLLLFSGAVGKSAQMPLHTWLPDAMEGPTPVSALIHAATMVTAGVYLVVRAHPLFEASGSALTVVAVVGIVTAIYAGFSAIGQDDIKRMLAYSTISQIGFMMFGAGIQAYSAAIFLLVCHACYKACLFMGAGSVMHSMDDELDMMKMGRLRRVMPVTGIAWWVAALAMAGLPPLSAFFSKDQLIGAAAGFGRYGLWIAALFGALLTALYIIRGTSMAFEGKERFQGHPHDPPSVMRLPMILLAIGAFAAGGLGVDPRTGLIQKFLAPVVGVLPPSVSPLSDLWLDVIAVVISIAGIVAAYGVYGSGAVDWQALRVRFGTAKRAALKGFYIDDAYSGTIGDPGKLLSAFLAYVVDLRIIDGIVGGVGWVIDRSAAVGRRVQTGYIRTYALVFFAGVIGILWWLAGRPGP